MLFQIIFYQFLMSLPYQRTWSWDTNFCPLTPGQINHFSPWGIKEINKCYRCYNNGWSVQERDPLKRGRHIPNTQDCLPSYLNGQSQHCMWNPTFSLPAVASQVAEWVRANREKAGEFCFPILSVWMWTPVRDTHEHNFL